METQATAFPEKQAKSQAVKSNYKGRTTLPPKLTPKEQPPFVVQSRVFGSLRNPNLQEKTIPEKPKQKRPSLKPTHTTVPPKEPTGKTALNPKLVPDKPTAESSFPKNEPVQITLTAPDKTAHNQVHISNNPTFEPCSKTAKPVQITPSVPNMPQKTANKPKSNLNDPTSEPCKTSKSAQTTSSVLKVLEKSAENPKHILNDLTNQPSPKTANLAEITRSIPEMLPNTANNPKSDPNESLPKTTKPVQIPPAHEFPLKTGPKSVQNKPSTISSPKIAQPVQITPLIPEDPKIISPNAKTVQKEPTTLPSPKESQPVHSTPSEPEKTTPIPNPVQDKAAIKPVQTTPVQEKTSSATKPQKKKVSFPEGNKRISTTAIKREKACRQTPGPTKPKPRLSGTPYYTAKKCSKCRFDRMETSSYWISLIKLAENVEKHAISAGLFKLALEAKAEPIRSLRVELKGYMSRYEYLSGNQEWRDLFSSYGLNMTPDNQVEIYEDGADLNREQIKQIDQQLESNLED